MIGRLTSRIALFALILAAMIAAEPRLSLAFEDRDDPRPRRFALTGEVMGQVLGLAISWSDRRRLR
jgi:hypothetical protein